MESYRTVRFDCGQVLSRRVAFVLCKAILRVEFVEGDHVAVAGYFSEDGGGGNAEALAVTTHD